MPKIAECLRCFGCGVLLDENQILFKTAWCGGDECAFEIIKAWIRDELDPDDSDNWEDE